MKPLIPDTTNEMTEETGTKNNLWKKCEDSQTLRVNLGCGTEKWNGFVNVDIDEKLNPDIVCDLRYEPLPFKNGSCEAIWMCHTIEHIQKGYWTTIAFEVNRLLKQDGKFILTYPEFEKCFEFWKINHLGKKEYWEACIYGRQASIFDSHVSVCHTPDMINFFRQYGFGKFRHSPEFEPQYSVLWMNKVSESKTMEDALNEVVFSNGKT